MSTKKKPKYEKIADELRKRILNGGYDVEEAMPERSNLRRSSRSVG